MRKVFSVHTSGSTELPNLYSMEGMITMATRLWKVVAGVAFSLVLTLTGCSRIDSALTKFDRAIEEVRKLRFAFQTEGAEWRRFIDEKQTNLTKDVRDIIREDLRATMLDATIEVHCLIDVVEGRVLAYLQAIESALIDARGKIKSNGGSKGITPEAIVARVIEQRRREAPHVCHCTPREGAITFSRQTSGSVKFVPSRSEIELVGFGLRRPEDEQPGLRLFVGSNAGGQREVPNSHAMLFANSSYKLLIDLTKLGEHLQATDQRLELRWGDEKVTEFKLTFNAEPVNVKKTVYVKLHYLDVYSRGLNKDHWQMFFSVRGALDSHCHKWEHDRIWDTAEKNAEPGPDNQDRTRTRFPIDHTLGPIRLREGDTLHVGCFGVAKVSDRTKEVMKKFFRKKNPAGWLEQTDIVPPASRSFKSYESWGLVQEPLTPEGAKFRRGEYSRFAGGPSYYAYFTVYEAK
jgi:hypothetical protein